MTSFEPGLIDANVLVYALDAQSQYHLDSRSLLDSSFSGDVLLYVTSQVMCEFYSIVTNAKRVTNPCSPAEAAGVISGLLTFLVVLPVPTGTVAGWLNLLTRREVKGPEIFDLQLAAVMLANGVRRIYTYNGHDFEPFPELVVVRP